MISQIEQARARGRGGGRRHRWRSRHSPLATHVLWCPNPWMLSPVVTVIPLQLLAYHIAALRGLDVDQPAISLNL